MSVPSRSRLLRASKTPWQSSLWRWNLAQGRWSPQDHGFPTATLFGGLSTDDHRPHERYDFWRQVACYDFSLDRESKAGSKGFSGKGSGLIGPEASLFISRSDALSGRRLAGQSERDGMDDVTIGLVVSGSRMQEEGGEHSVARSGDFFVYDARRGSRVVWTTMDAIFLPLRRRVVEKVLGKTPPSTAILARMLQASPVAAFLASQMRQLGQEAYRLGDPDRAGLLQTTVALANLAMRGIAESPDYVETQASRDVLIAAIRIIEVNLANPDLDPDRVAGLLGCSRARLYRSFSQQDTTVAGMIREMRLTRARELIETMPRHIAISDIAHSCGFLDVSHFSRVFRAHYGVRPTDIRG